MGVAWVDRSIACVDLSTALVYTTHVSPACRQLQKKRFVVGLKEALKAARSRKVSLVVLANNVDAAAGAAGFDEQVKDLLSMAEERGFTVVYALGE